MKEESRQQAQALERKKETTVQETVASPTPADDTMLHGRALMHDHLPLSDINPEYFSQELAALIGKTGFLAPVTKQEGKTCATK